MIPGVLQRLLTKTALLFADSISELAVREGLRNLQKSGATLIMIAHRLSMAFQADKIVVIEEGKCVESGSVAELMAPGCNSRFSQLVAAQTLGTTTADLHAATTNGDGSLPASGTEGGKASAGDDDHPLLAAAQPAVASHN
jgi:ABC-type multidrug transport system ATPase subunit